MDARIKTLALVLALLTLGAVACGSGSPTLRLATETDLQATVLQQSDVPSDYQRFDGKKEGLGLQHKTQPAGSPAQYGVNYQLSPDKANLGDLSCIEAASSLYSSETASLMGLQNFNSSLKTLGYVAVSASNLEPNMHAYTLSSTKQSYCVNYSDESAASYLVTFVRSNVVGAVRLVYRQREASVDPAVEYAKKQIADTESALKQ